MKLLSHRVSFRDTGGGSWYLVILTAVNPMYSPPQPTRSGMGCYPILEMRKLRLREVSHLPQVTQLERSRVGTWNQVRLTPEPLISTVSLTRTFSSFWICRPVILDPADPTWDVGNGAAWRWDLLAQEAESSYGQRCFLQAAGDTVKPWELPVSEGLPGSLGAFPNLCTQGFLSICCALGLMGCGTDGGRGGDCGRVKQSDRRAEPASSCGFYCLLTKLCPSPRWDLFIM